MSFIWIAIFAYLLFAVNAVIDKFLLHEQRIGHPAVYAFAIGALSQLVIVLAPFGFALPELKTVLLAFSAGALFTFALLVFFAVLKRGEASRIVPAVGGLVPLFTLALAYVLVGERLGLNAVSAFILLIAGTFLMSERKNGRLADNLWLMLLAGFLFAFSFTLTKAVFNQLTFINGFIWTRFGMGLGALVLLIFPGARTAVLGMFQKRQAKAQSTWGWFLTGQVVGALGSAAQNLAVALGSVTIVNALQGTQFAFLLLLTSVISLKYPQVLKEKTSQKVLAQKIIGIVLISLGVIVLAI